MEKKLTIQAVCGPIRSAKGIITSAKYASSSRRIRSTGVYAEQRRFSKEIILDYATNGYQHAADDAKVALPKVIAHLELKGFKVVEKEERFGFSSDLTKKVLIVELAN